jgi:opacity protein-like surface antigen
VTLKIRLGLIASILFCATSAAAQSDEDFASSPRWYGAFGFGYHWPQTVNSVSTRPAPDGLPYDWRWKTKSDAAMAGSIGYRLTPHVRAEIQAGYYNSSLLSAHAPGGQSGGLSLARPGEPWGLCATASVAPNCSPAGRQPASWSWMLTGMANVIYDVAPDRRLDPFVGVGVGFAHVEWAGDSLTYRFSGVPGVISPTNPALQTLKDAGTLDRPSQLAFQALGGLSYRVAPRIHLDLTYYHYFTPEKLRWNPEYTTPGLSRSQGLQPGDFLGRFQDDSLIVGVRYAF